MLKKKSLEGESCLEIQSVVVRGVALVCKLVDMKAGVALNA